MFPVEHLPEQAAKPESEHIELRDALDHLPEEQRTAVVLHYMEGYAVSDVAHMLRTSKGTICSRLYYARLKLRQWLKEDIE